MSKISIGPQGHELLTVEDRDQVPSLMAAPESSKWIRRVVGLGLMAAGAAVGLAAGASLVDPSVLQGMHAMTQSLATTGTFNNLYQAELNALTNPATLGVMGMVGVGFGALMATDHVIDSPILTRTSNAYGGLVGKIGSYVMDKVSGVVNLVNQA
jgi:hypothetical protein